MSVLIDSIEARLTGCVPLLISESGADSIDFVLSASGKVEDIDKLMASPNEGFWFSNDDWRSSYRPYNVDSNGILTIPVQGMLVSNSGFYIPGMITGYQYIIQAWRRAHADEGVKGIVFKVRSPGGETSENFDVVDEIQNTPNRKPTISIVSDVAHSAAYNIAAGGGDEIFVPRAGSIGSIGVIAVHRDISKALEDSGTKLSFISAPSDGYKDEFNPAFPLSEHARERLRQSVDNMYGLFVKSVASSRKLSEKDVMDTKAMTFSAEEGVRLGLADAVATPDEAYDHFFERIGGMTTLKTEGSGGDGTKAAADAARTEGYASGEAAGMKAGIEKGAKLAKSRIVGILSLDEAKGRPKAAMSVALKTAMDVDEAKSFLADLAPELSAESSVKTSPASDQGSAFDAAMRSENPNIKPDAEPAKEMSVTDQTLAFAKSIGLIGFGG